MNARDCCKRAEGDSMCKPLSASNQLGSRPPTFVRRFSDAIQWMVPTVILVLMPKCPVCIAAYVALGTGVGLSMATAGEIRILLLTLSVGSLIYLTSRYVVRRRVAPILSVAHPAIQSNSLAGQNHR